MDKIDIKWKEKASVCIVMASKGYPQNYEKEKIISGIDDAEKAGAYVFHSGTKQENNTILTNGGRVLGVTALGEDIATAQKNAYTAVNKISWNGAIFRKDIASKAL